MSEESHLKWRFKCGIAYCRILKNNFFFDKWKSGKSEISEISEVLFRVFLFPSFQFCPIAKIENLDLKISGKNFRVFQVFDLAKLNWSFNFLKIKTNSSWSHGTMCDYFLSVYIYFYVVSTNWLIYFIKDIVDSTNLECSQTRNFGILNFQG